MKYRIVKVWISTRAFQKYKNFEFGCGDQILTAFGLHETNEKKIMDIDPLYGPVRTFY